MVQKEYIFRFLRDLSNNNSKEWMDENRERYHTAKERWIEEVDLILDKLVKHDNYFQNFKPKDTLMRITNNRQFHPNKPIYKDHFSCSPINKGDAFARIYISVGVGHSFIGGGLWRPEKKVLKQVREAIDYDGEELRDILEDKKFQDFFGGLAHDPDKLKTSPRNYSNDHKHIELLRYNNLTAQVKLTQELVVSDDFVDYVEEAFVTLQPLNKFIMKAISVA
ncbi:DUF2461 domain-containing protein [Aquimarina sp. U1-2]|uniref:DUF2461 domain-containing protein n=1 Tax=Aquimarina sp. U1-2 TaxID=2823141 RepID=UPI001AECF370|nr:DUF2461 domain-containing protein [Aquimarina sp. U1-2]MBP2831085.1 DUF2461 domain-containing protein [Aquimarina sp. U1-2]